MNRAASAETASTTATCHQPDPIASDQWVELGRLAANLNQLQRAINRGQTEGVPVALVEELRRLLHDVRQALVGKAGAA